MIAPKRSFSDLIEGVDAGGEAVGADLVMSVGLAADVVRSLMPGGGDGQVGLRANRSWTG